MTKTQEKLIKYYEKNAIKEFIRSEKYECNYEIKKFEIEEDNFTGLVQVHIEVGLKGDEGTLAAVFARNSATMFIGKRGKIRYYDYTKWKCHTLGRYDSLLTIHCAQNHKIK